MRKLIKRFLGVKSYPIWVTLIIIFNGLIIAYAVIAAPAFAIVIVILVTLVLALFIFVITYVNVGDKIRLSPLFDRQYYVYEVLESNMEWVLTSSDGSQAKLTKDRKIRFMDNNISTLREYVWGDVYSTYKIPNKEDITFSPGIVSDIYAEGGMYVVIYTLDRSYNKYEELDTHYERIIRDGFLGAKEWVEYVPVANTKHEVLRVVFPMSRPPTSQTVKHRHGDFVELIEIGQEGFVKKLENDRCVLEWSIRNPVPRSSYLFEWEW